MSILKPKEETVDISVKEIKELIAHDLGVNPESISFKVKVELSNGLSYFNDSPIEKATALLATVTLPGKTQKFEIYENDLKQILEKYLEQSFAQNTFLFNYQKEEQGADFEFVSLSVAKKPELVDSQDLLSDSLSNMHKIVNSIEIKPQSLDEMDRTIDSLEDSIRQAREVMRRNKF